MTDTVAPARAVFHDLVVAAVEPTGDDAVVVTFAVPEPLAEAYRYRAGQHVALRCTRAGDDGRRSYSICSSEAAKTLQVGIKLLDRGVFSAFAARELRPGDVVEVSTPVGHFTTVFSPAASRHYLAIAAGSGITPILSLLTTALETEPGSSATCIYANRSTSSIMFLEDLAALKDRFGPRLQLFHVLSREPQPSELLSGRLDPERLRRLLELGVPLDRIDVVWCCGPFELTEQLAATLQRLGVAPERVHRELFHLPGSGSVGAAETSAKAPAQPRDGAATDHEEKETTGPALARATSEIEVTLDGRTVSVAYVDPDRSVLDHVLEVRPEAPYSCRSGICGTCRARVSDGALTMRRNYALEPDEIDAGYVLTCQGFPTTATLAISYDD
jgi:ring-1,2-phenylacetyl-CoA epoxidase subunit PaaE